MLFENLMTFFNYRINSIYRPDYRKGLDIVSIITVLPETGCYKLDVLARRFSALSQVLGSHDRVEETLLEGIFPRASLYQNQREFDTRKPGASWSVT
ncbi:hypothetical protein ElyMa_002176800 [Elysia marginata]|uniref:Uncharacterized protein n=1 Tax=Elysia marginata TaxID=1093978 RepID=A0AAV4FQG0_9GAST|nr:hypothetical protein ElyMa_002176800 [Elysia marginata]